MRTTVDIDPQGARYRCPTYSMGRPALNLDKALAVAGALADEETARKLVLRK